MASHTTHCSREPSETNYVLPSLAELNEIALQQREKTKALYGKEFHDKITRILSDGFRAAAAYFFAEDVIGEFCFAIPHEEVMPYNGLRQTFFSQYDFEHQQLRKCLESIHHPYRMTISDQSDTGDTLVDFKINPKGETIYMVLNRGRWIQNPNV